MPAALREWTHNLSEPAVRGYGQSAGAQRVHGCKTPLGYGKVLREGRKALTNIVDIKVPMITALDGPVLTHSEYALLTDIVLATPEMTSRTSLTSSSASCPATGCTSSGPR